MSKRRWSMAWVMLTIVLGSCDAAHAASPRLVELQQQEQRLLTLRRNLVAALDQPDMLIVYGGEGGPAILWMPRAEAAGQLIANGLVQPRGEARGEGLHGLLVELPEAMAALGGYSDRMRDMVRTRLLPDLDHRLAEVRRAAAELATADSSSSGLRFDHVVPGVVLDTRSALGRLIHIDDITADESEGRAHVRIRFGEGRTGCIETYQLRWSFVPEIGYLPRDVDIRVNLDARRTSAACSYGLYAVELSARGSAGATMPAWLKVDGPRTDAVTTLRGASAVTGGNNPKWSRPGAGTATIRVHSAGIPVGPQFRSLYFWVDIMARTPLEEAVVRFRLAHVLKPE